MIPRQILSKPCCNSLENYLIWRHGSRFLFDSLHKMVHINHNYYIILETYFFRTGRFTFFFGSLQMIPRQILSKPCCNSQENHRDTVPHFSLVVCTNGTSSITYIKIILENYLFRTGRFKFLFGSLCKVNIIYTRNTILTGNFTFSER